MGVSGACGRACAERVDACTSMDTVRVGRPRWGASAGWAAHLRLAIVAVDVLQVRDDALRGALFFPLAGLSFFLAPPFYFSLLSDHTHAQGHEMRHCLLYKRLCWQRYWGTCSNKSRGKKPVSLPEVMVYANQSHQKSSRCDKTTARLSLFFLLLRIDSCRN